MDPDSHVEEGSMTQGPQNGELRDGCSAQGTALDTPRSRSASQTSRLAPEETTIDGNPVPPDPEKKPAPPAGMTFPEGGVAAWTTCLGGFLGLFSTFGLVNAFGVFQAYYTAPGGPLASYSNSDVSWIGSIQLFFLFATSVVVGPLFDRYSAQLFMIPGAILLSLSLMMLSICKDGHYYEYFLSQGILQGIAIGIFFLPCIGCVSHWFMKRRGLAVGIAISGSSLGGVIWPIVLNRLLNQSSLGFGWSVRTVGFMVLVTSGSAALLCRKRLPPSNHGRKPDMSFLKNPAYLLVLAAFFLSLLGLFTPFFFITESALQDNVDPDLSFYLLAILNAGSFFGRILPGLVADRFGRFNMLAPFVLLTSIVVYALISVHSTGSYVVASLFFGFFSGAVISLQPVCIAQLIPDPRDIGIGIGASFATSSIAALTGAPIAGAIVSASGFSAAYAFAASVIMGGCLAIVASRLVQSRQLMVKL